MDEKKSKEKKKRPAQNVEPWWHELKAAYFSFFKSHFRDPDGFAMSPDWNPQKIGMEASALKKIIIFLRERAELKKIEWSCENAVKALSDFLNRAYHKDNRIRYFYCALLNKNKLDILCSSYNPYLSKKILEEWYFLFPEYTRDIEKDKAASEVVIGFLKQQYVLNSLPFEDNSVVQSFSVIAKEVKLDEWWNKKPLMTIAKNLQEFVNRIKFKKNGNRQETRQGVMDALASRNYERKP